MSQSAAAPVLDAPGEAEATIAVGGAGGAGKAPKIKIAKEFYAADDAYGWRATAMHLLPIPVLLGLAGYWASLGYAAFVPLLLVPLGVYAYKLTIVLHECSHYSLFRTRKYNKLVGTVAGWFLGSDFAAFTKLHWLHHSVYGEPADPQGSDYLGLRDAPRGRIAWHLLRPLFGYNLKKLFSFNPAAGDAAAPAENKRWRHLVGVLTTQVVLAAIATWGGRYPLLVLLFPASAATVGLFLSQIRGFCEHIPAPDENSEAFVRTHLPNAFDRVFFYGLNFNYHVEHHLFPSVPCRNLPRLYREYGHSFHGPATVSPTILGTIRSRLAQCP